MATLTNHSSDCELLNLRYNPNGRGPYVIRQDGIPPGSSTLGEDRFFLRKDGTWVLNFAVFVLPEKEQEQKFVYTDIAEVLSTLQTLLGRPVVEVKLPDGTSRAEVLAAMSSTNSRIWSRIRDARGTKITP